MEVEEVRRRRGVVMVRVRVSVDKEDAIESMEIEEADEAATSRVLAADSKDVEVGVDKTLDDAGIEKEVGEREEGAEEEGEGETETIVVEEGDGVDDVVKTGGLMTTTGEVISTNDDASEMTNACANSTTRHVLVTRKRYAGDHLRMKWLEKQRQGRMAQAKDEAQLSHHQQPQICHVIVKRRDHREYCRRSRAHDRSDPAM